MELELVLVSSVGSGDFSQILHPVPTPCSGAGNDDDDVLRSFLSSAAHHEGIEPFLLIHRAQ